MEQEEKRKVASAEARMHIVGIDVAKAKLDAALQVKGGKWKTKVVANTTAGFQELRAWLAKHGARCAHVCMEATGVYWENIAADLADNGYAVSVENPLQIKRFGESQGVRTKTDKVDAKVIGEYCARIAPALWNPPSVAVRRLRALVNRRDALVDLRTQEMNRLAVSDTQEVRTSIQHVIAVLSEEISQIEKQVGRDIDQDPTLKKQTQLLESIPGIGEATSSTLLSHYGGELRFEKSRQAVAFAGLDTQQHESGSSVRGKPRTSKKGHSALRAALYWPAITAMRYDFGKAFTQRLKAAGKPGKVVITAMMRKLLTIAYGVLKSGKPFDPALHT